MTTHLEGSVPGFPLMAHTYLSNYLKQTFQRMCTQAADMFYSSIFENCFLLVKKGHDHVTVSRIWCFANLHAHADEKINNAYIRLRSDVYYFKFEA
jgi:hypothetical protein